LTHHSSSASDPAMTSTLLHLCLMKARVVEAMKESENQHRENTSTFTSCHAPTRVDLLPQRNPLPLRTRGITMFVWLAPSLIEAG